MLTIKDAACSWRVTRNIRAADVVRISEVDKPAPRDHELLVKVHATTVNRTDCHYRSGRPWVMRPLVSGLTRPRAAVLGNEFAGEVVGAGSGVTSFQVGDRVFGYTEGPFGAHAEYLVIGEDGRVAAMPTNLGYEQAAPGTEGAPTMRCPTSGGQRSAAARTCWSMAPPGPSARQRSSC
jgi:NADPH:quinone reductase-like Zn-dependent oxidoreductase